MREGVDRDGHHLYPAFPYDHFTHSTRRRRAGALRLPDDARAGATRRTAPNDLRFPLSFRPLLAGWNLLFLDRRRYRPDAGARRRMEPRRLSGRGARPLRRLPHAAQRARAPSGAAPRSAGGEAEGWYAPALDAASPSPHAVDRRRSCRPICAPASSTDHAIAGGPMQRRGRRAWRAPRADVRGDRRLHRRRRWGAERRRSAVARGEPARAAAGRCGSGDGRRSPRRRRPRPIAAMLAPGGAVYADACARCHDRGRGVRRTARCSLPLAVAVLRPRPAQPAPHRPRRHRAAGRRSRAAGCRPSARRSTDAQLAALARLPAARRPRRAAVARPRASAGRAKRATTP